MANPFWSSRKPRLILLPVERTLAAAVTHEPTSLARDRGGLLILGVYDEVHDNHADYMSSNTSQGVPVGGKSNV